MNAVDELLLTCSQSTINGYIAAQTDRTPEAIAVECGGTSLTYAQLDEQSNRIARVIARQGIGSGDVVGIAMKRSPQTLAAMLGVLKAGAAYLPLDMDFPAERLDYMLEDSRSRMLIADCEKAGRLTFHGAVLHMERDNWKTEDGRRLPVTLGGEDLAYVMYTSGSTGRPKGVMIEHRSVCNLIEGIRERIEFPSGGKILGLTTISFDIFVLETWLPLSVGMTVVMATEREQKDPWELGKLIAGSGVDMMQATPSRMNWMLHATDGSYMRGLRTIMLGGEGVPGVLVDKLQQVSEARIYNMYGPTETTVWSCCGEQEPGKDVHVGTPIRNTRLYLMDGEREVLEEGARGELCIAGDGLARGYWNRDELTAEKFIKHPSLPHERMYRTGDLAERLANGTWRIIGRQDQQVKIRGHRIELGEIESVLMESELVKEAAVIPGEEGTDLIAYVAVHGNPEPQEIRQYASRRLPSYMIPARYIVLPELPVTPNGKIDRVRLNERVGIPTQETDDIEQRFSAIWNEVLDADTAIPGQNFFSEGGDSYKAIKLIAMLNKHLQWNLSLIDLYQSPTYKGLYQLGLCSIRQEQPADRAGRDLEDFKTAVWQFIQSAGKPALNRDNIEAVLPLSDIQLGMVYHSLGEKGVYHDQYLFEWKGPQTDIASVFLRAMSEVAERHPMLRTCYYLGSDFKPFQMVLQQVELDWREYDASDMEPDSDSLMFIRRMLEQDRERPFITHPQPLAPLWRGNLFRLPDGRTLFNLNVHHSIFDGKSLDILLEELRLSMTGESKPDSNRSGYRLFEEFLSEQYAIKNDTAIRDYWIRNLEKQPQEDLFSCKANDFQREQPPYRSHTSQIDNTLGLRINDLAKAERVHPRTIFLAAFGLMVEKKILRRDQVLGVVETVRPIHEYNNHAIGCYIHTVPVRLRNLAGLDRSELLIHCDKILNDSKHYGKLSTYEIEKCVRKEHGSRTALCPIIFNYREMRQDCNEFARFPEIDHYEVTHNEFDCIVTKEQEDYRVKVVYKPSVVSESTVKAMVEEFKKELQCIVSARQVPPSISTDVCKESEDTQGINSSRAEGETITRIRGHRIELGEIESVLMESELVKEAAVIPGEEGTDLIAYVAVHGNPEPQEIRQYEVEEELSGLFQDVMSFEFDRKMNFFEQGVDSFSIITLFVRINEQFPDSVTVSDLFGYTTIEKLAGYISDKSKVVIRDFRFTDFPLEYYQMGGLTGRHFRTVHFGIEKELCKSVWQSANASPEVLFALIFMYVLSEMTDQPECQILWAGDQVVSIEINFENFDGLEEMLGHLNQQIRSQAPFDLRGLNGRGDRNIVPAFIGSHHTQRLPMSDLRLLYREEHREYRFYLECNSAILNQQLAETVVRTFGDALEGLMTNLQKEDDHE